MIEWQIKEMNFLKTNVRLIIVMKIKMKNFKFTIEVSNFNFVQIREFQF